MCRITVRSTAVLFCEAILDSVRQPPLAGTYGPCRIGSRLSASLNPRKRLRPCSGNPTTRRAYCSDLLAQEDLASAGGLKSRPLSARLRWTGELLRTL